MLSTCLYAQGNIAIAFTCTYTFQAYHSSGLVVCTSSGIKKDNVVCTGCCRINTVIYYHRTCLLPHFGCRCIGTDDCSMFIVRKSISRHRSRRLKSDLNVVDDHYLFVPLVALHVPQHVAVSRFEPMNQITIASAPSAKSICISGLDIVSVWSFLLLDGQGYDLHPPPHPPFLGFVQRPTNCYDSCQNKVQENIDAQHQFARNYCIFEAEAL